MKIHEALDIVSRFYRPGVAGYFAQFSPDPWQAAHDELERVAGVFDPDIVAPAASRFVERCRELVSRFIQDGKPSSSVSPSDAFTMTRTSVDAHMSRRFKRCARCESRESLKIVPIADGGIDVQLICGKCMAKTA